MSQSDLSRMLRGIIEELKDDGAKAKAQLIEHGSKIASWRKR